MQRNQLHIAALKKEFKGNVIAPGDALYDKARTVFLGGIDRKPAVIIRPIDSSEVARVVMLARETGLPLAVKSGGHSGAAHSMVDGGIVLDLHDMKAIDINVVQKTAWAQTGLTAVEMTGALDVHNLAIGFGDTGSVGIGGITLGGGIGFLVRKFGLTIDNVLAADIVTADGKLHTVDASHEADLFWAIRGGGGNFGVVTRFQFRLHELSLGYGGMLMLPATAGNIAACMKEAAEAPRELSAIFNVMPAPPMPMIPAGYQGKLVIMALMMYAGDPKTGEQAIQPFRALGAPIVDMVHAMRYKEIFSPEDESYHPLAISQTMFMRSVDQGAGQFIMDKLRASDAQMRVVQMRALGGAVTDVAPDATAYAHRNSAILTNIAAFYTGPSDKKIREDWVAEVAHALNQGDLGEYVNFVGNEGEAGVRAAYPQNTWDRLQKIKTIYDPTNLFHLNQNIPPARG